VRQHAARVSHEQLQQLVLRTSQFDPFGADLYSVTAGIQLELLELERLGCLVDDAAP
jgi:hypothetical protein